MPSSKWTNAPPVRYSHVQVWPEPQRWHWTSKAKKTNGSRKPCGQIVFEETDVAGDVQQLVERDLGRERAQRDSTLLLTALENKPYARETVEDLLQLGAKIEARTHTGATPVILAAASGGVEMLRVLEEWGADMRAVDTSGATALTLAAFKGRVGAVSHLLGLHGGVGEKLLSACTRKGETALMAAAKGGSHQAIQALLQAQQGKELVGRWSKGDCRSTALHFAADKGCGACVEALVGGGEDPDQEDGRGLTPLLRAAKAGNLPAVQALLHFAVSTRGPPLSRVDGGGGGGPPEDQGLEGGEAEVETSRVEGEAENVSGTHDPEKKEEVWVTQADHLPVGEEHCRGPPAQNGGLEELGTSGPPVGSFGMDNRWETGWAPSRLEVRVAEKRGRRLPQTGDLLAALTPQGLNALHLAAQHGQLQVAEYLVDVAGVEVNCRVWDCPDGLQPTPLIAAARAGHTQIVKMLIRAGADVELRAQGRTALGWAASAGSCGAVRALVEEGGADMLAQELKSGLVAQQLALKHGRLKTVTLLADLARARWRTPLQLDNDSKQ